MKVLNDHQVIAAPVDRSNHHMEVIAIKGLNWHYIYNFNFQDKPNSKIHCPQNFLHICFVHIANTLLMY